MKGWTLSQNLRKRGKHHHQSKQKLVREPKTYTCLWPVFGSHQSFDWLVRRGQHEGRFSRYPLPLFIVNFNSTLLLGRRTACVLVPARVKMYKWFKGSNSFAFCLDVVASLWHMLRLFPPIQYRHFFFFFNCRILFITESGCFQLKSCAFLSW